ncbi:HAD hydrolase family protein [bacterium]|nr:HAD hydrolase family protein [bacterium]
MAQADLSKLKDISTFVFDVDGVFTDGQILVTEEGKLLRSMNIKDGYALKTALNAGYKVLIITGGKSEGVQTRFQNLGVQWIYQGISNKEECIRNAFKEHGILPHECLYMGDDLPDLPAMQHCHIKVAPRDAAWEVCSICDFVTAADGGKGAVREIIEKVLKLRGDWKY